MASGIIDSEFLGLQTIEHVMRVSRTWDSIVSLVPKGGETIWGNLDWSPEEGHECDQEKESYLQLSSRENNSKISDGKSCFKVKHPTKYGRIISFGKEASELRSSHLPTFSKVQFYLCSRWKFVLFTNCYATNKLKFFLNFYSYMHVIR